MNRIQRSRILKLKDNFTCDGKGKLNNTTCEKGCRDFIDAWSQGIDAGCDFKISSNGRLFTVKADAKKGYRRDDHVKGLNATGGFQVPERRKVELVLGRTIDDTTTFDSFAKSDLNTFSVSSYSTLKLTNTSVNGGSHAIYVPDNAKNAFVDFTRGIIRATKGSAIYISAGADNTKLSVIGEYNYDCGGAIENRGSGSNLGLIIFSKIDPPNTDPDWYT